MTPEEVNKKYGYGQYGKSNDYSNINSSVSDKSLKNNNKDFGNNLSKGSKNMSVTKKKNIVGVFVFVALQAMYLFSHFTVGGAVCTLLVLLYLIIRNIVNNKNISEDLTTRIGNYIAASFLNIVIVTLCQVININSILLVGESPYLGFAIFAIFLPVIFLIVYSIASSMITKKGPITSVLKYFIPYVTYSFFLSAIFPTEAVGNICPYSLAIFYIIFWIVDLFVQKNNGKADKSIVIIAIITNSLFIVLSAFNQKFAERILYGFTHLNSLNNWEWYNVAIIALIFVIAACICFAVDNAEALENEQEIAINSDIVTLLLIGYDIVCFAIGIKFYTKYIAIFAIMLLMVNFITLIMPFKKFKNDSVLSRIFNNKFVTEIIMMGVLIALYFGFINGVLDIIIILILYAVAVAALFFHSNKKYNFFLVLSAILACDLAYHWHNSISNYMLIFAIAIIFSLILIIIGICNKECVTDYSNILLCKIIVLVLGTIMMLTPMSHTGAHIYDKIEVPSNVVSQTEESQTEDEATITINIRPHGKNNKITSCSYYWTSEADKINTPELKDNSFSIKKNGADTLVVVCCDANGVVTTYKHSYNIKV